MSETPSSFRFARDDFFGIRRGGTKKQSIMEWKRSLCFTRDDVGQENLELGRDKL